MKENIILFSVGNGDTTLIKLPSGKTLLIDFNCAKSLEGVNTAEALKAHLEPDELGRYTIDAYLLSHPDEDHCLGLSEYFHLGPPEDWKGDRILIGEIWSSPMIFRRANSTNHVLCGDAKAFNAEAKRRVRYYQAYGDTAAAGNRVRILGQDSGGKTDDLMGLVAPIDSEISTLNGEQQHGFSARLLGPLPFADDEGEEAELAKNDSSVILQITLLDGGEPCHFLTGGDAQVGIWERLWARHGSTNPEWLHYDLLLAPHHCSWRSLSHDSWQENGHQARVSPLARNALGQARVGAHIVASSKPIKYADSDPPSHRAKTEYEAILENVAGTFQCTGEYKLAGVPTPLVYAVGAYGLQLLPMLVPPPSQASKSALRGKSLPHG